MTTRGAAFLDGDLAVVRKIDEAEGLPQLLTILATKTRAKSGDLLPEWSAFLHAFSNFPSESKIKKTLRNRLENLVDRGFVAREGQTSYVITEAGVNYAAQPVPVIASGANGTRPVPVVATVDPRREVLQAITAYNESQRKVLRERLATMDPYRFEHLIGDLLEAMGYEDVEVTKASGDKGIDVIGTIRSGFSIIREYVQVKRHQGSIGGPTVNELRGSLLMHGAIRGTIITTSTFTTAAKDAASSSGVVPISLIAGKELLELLLEHKLGVIERPATLYEVDEGFFSQPAKSESIDEVENF